MRYLTILLFEFPYEIRQVGRLKNLIRALVGRGTVRDLILWGQYGS